jgi:hypothetical protein
MYKSIIVRLIASISMAMLIGCPALAQTKGNQPKSVLLSAFTSANKPNTIFVLFGDKFPVDPQAPADTRSLYPATSGPFAKDKWIVRAVNLQTHKLDDAQSQIASVEVKTNGQLVNLNMMNPVDTASFTYVIIYAEANTPIVTLNQPEKSGPQKIFTASKGKSDADIYVSGEAVAGRNSKPAYSIETKFSYLHNLIGTTQTGIKNHPVRFTDYGSLGGTFTFDSSANSTIDPDSITAAGTYQRTFLIGPSPTGILLNSNFIGFELDKDDKTRNLLTEADATLVLPSKRLNSNKARPIFTTMDFMLGIEGGHNYKNTLQPQGLGNFWRPKVGADFYLFVLNPAIFNRITFNAEYKLRLPRSAEIFSEIVNGSKTTFLTKKPRHYVAADLDFMFAPSYGITLKYRYGSLPPTFNLVDNKVSAGFVLQLQQTNK